MRYLIFIYLVLNLFSARASHIVGGEIYYDYLGNNNYKFYISVYRDCLSTGASFDNPLSLGLFNSNNQLIQNIQINFSGSSNVPVVFNNPCVTPPNNICTENSVYTVTLNLPPAAGGYTLAYQRCCRGPNINNIDNPGDTGFTLWCHVPGTTDNNYINSSPRFNGYPPLLLCNNEELVFDHSATDPDGDQLVYSLVTPYSGANGLNPAPNPPPAPPYSNITWAGGNNAANPLGPGATISIDSTTGLLTASPNITGLYAVGIQVQEIRNGVVINQITRDFLFKVFNCNLQINAVLPLQPQLSTFTGYCTGLGVQFENQSTSQVPPTYSWDFGVPGISTDVSSAFAPSYTYPAPGQYTVTLVVNPGVPCTDTAFMEVIVGPPFDVTFTSEDSLCFSGNNFNFISETDAPNGTTIEWDFGLSAITPIATGATINNIQYSTSGYMPVTVEASFFLCNASFTDSVFVFPNAIAGMIYPDTVECKGLEINFINDSQNSLNYHWDFGVSGVTTDESTAIDPTFTFPSPGTYAIELIASASPECADTIQEVIVINHKLEVAFTSEDSLCHNGNSFNFIGDVFGPVGSTYTWIFGPHGSIASSGNIIENGVSFDTTGSILVSLTGEFNICRETAYKRIYIYRSPEIGFLLESGLQCVPFNAQFIDLSSAETPISYLWDFGDGTTSSVPSPSHLFENVGNYPITLTIWTSAGCVDTLTQFEPDVVNVRPIPEAKFSVSPNQTDICHSEIQFTNLSSLGQGYLYIFDDGTTSNEENPLHVYLEDGTLNPRMLVTSEYGCQDTSFETIFIEPFTIYAPNAFTPDGDEANNVFTPIVDLQIVEWNLQIYNRWGELIFESNDPNIGWDGTNAIGKVSQDGIYMWKLRYTSCEPANPEHLIKGHISLLR